MKNKIFLCALLAAALFAVFALCCSAATITTQINSGFWPLEVNVAQPKYTDGHWDEYADTYDLKWGSATTPGTAGRSSLNVALPYYTPDNNQVRCGSTGVINCANENIFLRILSASDIFGSMNLGKQTFTEGVCDYITFVVDFGSSSGQYSTSAALLDGFAIFRSPYQWSGNWYEEDVSADSVYYMLQPVDNNPRLRSATVPANGTYPDEWHLVWMPRATSANTPYSNYYFYINYVWAIPTNKSSVSSFDYTRYSCGYTTAYMNTRYVSPLGEDDIVSRTNAYISQMADYWYNNGYDSGVKQSTENAYRRGYAAALTSYGEDPVTIRSLIFSIPDGLVHMLRSLFDFEFLGYNLFYLFKFLFTLLAVAIVIRFTLKAVL